MKRDDSIAGCEKMDQRLSSCRKTMTQIPTVKPTSRLEGIILNLPIMRAKIILQVKVFLTNKLFHLYLPWNHLLVEWILPIFPVETSSLLFPSLSLCRFSVSLSLSLCLLPSLDLSLSLYLLFSLGPFFTPERKTKDSFFFSEFLFLFAQFSPHFPFFVRGTPPFSLSSVDFLKCKTKTSMMLLMMKQKI